MDVAKLHAALLAQGVPAAHIRDAVGSTNDVARALGDDAPDGTVVWAEEQTAGRGRRDRTWDSPAFSGIWMSSLWRLDVPPTRWGWIPLVTGLAVRDAVHRHGVMAELKWPNDVVVGHPPKKIAGILAEIVGDMVVIGTGMNVTAAPVPGATCMAECGGSTDRVALSATLAGALRQRVAQWREEPESLQGEYSAACSTIGQVVHVELERDRLVGQALGIDSEGHLLVRDISGIEHIVTAGDVVHATIST